MRRGLLKLIRLTFLCAALLLLILLVFRIRYKGIIDELAQTKVRNATSDLTNEAIDAQIGNGDIAYDRIVFFEKDINGKITALKTNIGEINRLKTEILKNINQRILKLDTSDIGIPLGNLILPELLSGHGPIIPVKILSIRNSNAEFFSDFSQAGINQTLHRLIMQVHIDVSVLVLGDTNSFTVNSQVIVAETVIIGDVPNTYLQTGGSHDSQRENGLSG